MTTDTNAMASIDTGNNVKEEPADKVQPAPSTTNYVYLLACADGSFYCGWTNDLEKRVNTHNMGRGAKYTKPRRPVVLVYYEAFETKREAMSREAAIKRMTRKEKEALVRTQDKTAGGTR